MKNLMLLPIGTETVPVVNKGLLSRVSRLPLGPIAVTLVGVSGSEHSLPPLFFNGTLQTALPAAPPETTGPTVRFFGKHGGDVGCVDVVVVGISAGMSSQGTGASEGGTVVAVVTSVDDVGLAEFAAPVPQADRVRAITNKAA